MIRRFSRGLMLLAFCAAMFLSSCMDPEEQPVTWSYVYETIVQPNCSTSNCHSALAATAGLQFHVKEGAYSYLTGRLCDNPGIPGEASHNFVVPYQPERSKLMYLLRGEETWRMPPDIALPDVEIELVERWILEGAECD